jgi:hypothetical protein
VRRTAVLGVAAWLCAGGCAERAAPQEDADATVQKLKQLQAAGTLPPREPARQSPNEKLAQVSAHGAEGQGPRPRPLPASNPTAYVGTVAVKLVEVSTAQRVAAGKLQLVTGDTFLLVKLLAQNVGKAGQSVDLAAATLSTADGAVGLARDVQRAVGGAELSPRLEPGGEEDRQEWTLAFELSPALLGRGLALKLGGTTVPLE